MEEQWAVITDEGLTLYINLTEGEARLRARERRDVDKGSWAVTMEEAAELQAAWSALGEDYAGKLRLARMRVVTRLLRQSVFV